MFKKQPTRQETQLFTHVGFIVFTFLCIFLFELSQKLYLLFIFYFYYKV